jgi:hypothetical protein
MASCLTGGREEFVDGCQDELKESDAVGERRWRETVNFRRDPLIIVKNPTYKVQSMSAPVVILEIG